MVRTVLVVIMLAACAHPAPPAAPASRSSGKLTMKSYFLVLLRRGPAWAPDETPESKKIFEGHMANINAMAKTGKLIIAGPMDAPADDRTAIAGLFLFEDASRADVDAMIANDPAIKIQRLVPEVLTWYGPAGLTYPGKLENPK
jgi:uncharacterized protein YciI